MTDTVYSVSWREWAAVGTLGIGSFAIVTTELAPIGLLSQIGGDLSQPPHQVGLIVTLYAWIAAAAALTSARLLGNVPRRPLMIGLMLILSVSAAIAATADSFEMLMLARVVGALAHGAFWAMIGTLGAQIVPARKVGVATSIIFGGVSAASVLGVPLANFIGTTADWRTVFMAIAVMGFVVSAAFSFTLPRLEASGGIRKGTLMRVAKDTRFFKIFVATLLSITAHFMAFTYVEPFLSDKTHMPTSAIAPLLFAFGAAGLAANVVTGALIDSRLKATLVTSLVLGSIALLTLSIAGSSLGLWGTAMALLIWGGAVAAIFVGFQTWILKEAGADAMPASAIYVALFNAAIGLGAVVGSIVLKMGDLSGLYLIAAICIGLGMLAIAMLKEPKEIGV